MIVYQPIVKATAAQFAVCQPWLRSVDQYAQRATNKTVDATLPPGLGFDHACTEKDYAIISRMAIEPYVLCLDWDIELLPGFGVGGDEIWVGADHCSLCYNGNRCDVFAAVRRLWDAHRDDIELMENKPLWKQGRNRGWKCIDRYRKEHPEVVFNQIPRSTYIHHQGEVK